MAKLEISDRLLTTEEAADFLGIHPTSLAKARCYGTEPKISYVRVGLRAIRYRLSTLEDFADSRTISPDDLEVA
jgi:hypothetical protein